MYKRVGNGRLLEYVGLLFYKIALDLAYVFFISNLFGYKRTFQLEPNGLRILESWALYVILIVCTTKKKSITSYFLLMQLTITLAPMLSIYGLYDRSRFFIYLLCGVHCLQCLVDEFFKIPGMLVTRRGGQVIIFVVAILACGTLGLVYLKYGIPGLEALNFNEVYEIRDERTLSFPLSYIVPWFFGVMLPIGMLEALSRKNMLMVFLFGGIAMYLYLIFARKSWFFSVFLIVGFYILVKYNLFRKVICWGLPLAVAALTGLYYVDERLLMLPSLFVRRLLFVPADIKFEYYDFLHDKEKLYFAEGVIGKLFEIHSPYEEGIARIIGDRLDTGSCNTGYLVDAYANLGVWGVILFALILIFILKLLDSVSKEQYFVFNFSALSYCLYSLNDAALLTTLLTGGMLFVIIMLIIRNQKGSVFSRE